LLTCLTTTERMARRAVESFDPVRHRHGPAARRRTPSTSTPRHGTFTIQPNMMPERNRDDPPISGLRA